MKLSRLVAIASCLALCAQAHAQTLVYSVSYAETQASFHAHFANVSPFPGGRTHDENLTMMRHTRKTEIYSVSVPDGKRTLVFSDEGPHFDIRPTGAVSSSGKAYVVGFFRDWQTAPVPGVHEDQAYYEIPLDGSNHFRKLADAQQSAPNVELNAQGTKAALMGFENEKYIVSIYSLPEWKLLGTWDLAKITRTHCPGCTPTSNGWMADGNRLYVSFVVVGEDDDDTAKANHPGTYILGEDGTDLGAIPATTGAFQLAGYFHPNFIERQFLGQFPDGRYLFLDYGAKQGKSPGQTEPFLVMAGADGKPQKTLPLKFPIGGYISPSGKFLAYIERRQTPDYRSELHLWVKNLESNEDKELISTPPPGPPSSPEPNSTISILGWIN
jgi:hypothetical protein